MFSSTAIDLNALPPLVLLYMPPLLRAKAKAIAAQEPLALITKEAVSTNKPALTGVGPTTGVAGVVGGLPVPGTPKLNGVPVI